MDISNQIGQLNIYLKASYLLDVLKDFCTNMTKAYPTLVEKYQIQKYQPIIQSGRIVELRDMAQGDNKCRSCDDNLESTAWSERVEIKGSLLDDSSLI